MSVYEKHMAAKSAEKADGNGQLKISQQQREQLKRRIAERPSRQKLVTQHILLCPSSVDPLIQARCQDLKKNKLVDNLNRKLQKRPGPLELVTKKILQVDAELEEALQEGLLPFQSTSSKNSKPSSQSNIINYSGLAMLSEVDPVKSSDLMKTEHVPRKTPLMMTDLSANSEACLWPMENETRENSKHILAKKISGNGHPSDNSSTYIPGANDLTQKLAETSSGSSPVSVIAIRNDNEAIPNRKDSNYKNLLKQQEILLEWQEDIVEEEEEEEEIRDDDNGSDEKKAETDLPTNDSYVAASNATAETPPCLLTAEQQEVKSMQADKFTHVHHENHRHSSQEHKSQKCCQCTVETASLNVGDNAPSSTTTELISVISSRLMEFKVQDLKKECRKRQLAASGTKYQILQRLKPFEETVFAEFISRNVTVSSCPSAKTPRAHTSANIQKNGKSSKKSAFSSAPNSTIDMSVIDAVASNIKAKSGSKEDAMKMGPPIRDVIHDYLQQNQTTEKEKASLSIQKPSSCCERQNKQHAPLMSQMPNGVPAPRQQQIIQLMDANGVVLSRNKPICLPTLTNKAVIHNTSSKPLNTTSCCNCSHEEPQRFSTNNNNLQQDQFNQSHQKPKASILGTATAENHQLDVNGRHQKFPESTFSFAQMGSGGQFTLAESSSNPNNNGHMTAPVNSVASSFAPLNYARKAPSACINPFACDQQSSLNNASFLSSSQSYSQNKAAFACTPYQKQCNSTCNCSRDAQNSHLSLVQTQQQFPYFSGNNSQSQNLSAHANSINETSSRRRHSFASTPCSSAIFDSNQGQQHQEQFLENEFSSTSSPMIMEQHGNEFEEVQTPKPLQIDPSDPNSLLSANTLSNHEETLRYQQKKIHELQKELSKSQQHLRQQQQMIWIAKKAQVRCDATGRQQTQAEFWLNQLDTKVLKNNHIQNILQHKTQQQQLQTQIAEHKQLVSTEQKLQEELHIDQAVTDIVRLIKQDSKTALLIVQLLRRYQLERTHELFDATNQQALMTAKSSIHEQQPMECCHLSTNDSQCNDELMILEDTCKDCQKKEGHSSSTNTSISTSTKPKKKALYGSKSSLEPRSQSTSGQRFSPVSKVTDDISMKKKTVVSKRGSNSSTLDASNSSSVDMDEIFRTVLKNTNNKPLNGSAQKSGEMISPKSLQHTILKAGSEIQVEGDEISKAKKMRRKRQSNEANDAESNALKIMPQFDNFHLTTTPTTYGNETMAQLACCSDLIPSVESTDLNNQSVITSTSLDINCFNKASASEHASLQSFSKSGATFDYIKNHAFDDLMDVLRDDQEKSLLGLVDSTPSSNDYSLTTDELVNFLASDEDTSKFCLDSHFANNIHPNSFENVTDFASYEDMQNQLQQQNLHNYSYNTMNQLNSNNFPSNRPHVSQFHHQPQHSNNPSSHAHYHHHPDSMDIIPPHSIQNSSVDGQHSRDEGFSSSSVCSTTSFGNEQHSGGKIKENKMSSGFNQQNSNAGLFDANDQDMDWFENIDMILESDSLGNGFVNNSGLQPSVRPMDAFV